MTRQRALATFIAVALLSLAGCQEGHRTTNSRRTCIADSVGTLHLAATVPTFKDDEWWCRAKCLVGSSASCLGLAYRAERDPKKEEEAFALYRRACLLGEANACTNFAARLWGVTRSDADLTCARRTFEKSCAAKEAFACGMVGRMMIDSTTPPAYAEARKFLEHACYDVGGFPCRVLAMHLETGKLGEYKPGTIQALLKKACADRDPCGEHPTAAETFRER